MNVFIRTTLVAAALMFVVRPVLAQDADPRFDEGIAAFREARFETAQRLFDDVVTDDPENAQAYYMLARIYFETPLRDDKQAGKLLGKAIDLDPENVDFLVARLEQLREDHVNFLVDRVRDRQRIVLANSVLKLDPENGVAHEELGTAYVRDFWRYRNAISLPTLGLRSELMRRERMEFDPGLDEVSGDPGDNPAVAGAVEDAQIAADQNFLESIDQFEFRNDDLFNINRLRAQGVPVQQLSGRSDRAYKRAVGHLKQALDSDPMRRSVYDQLMKIYALKGEYQEALATLGDMYSFFPDDPVLWLYLGYAHYESGQMDAASKSFETALRLVEPDVRYAFENIDLFLASNERDLYAADTVAFASRFWTSKDPRYLTTYNERKLEHYARLVYSDLLYGAPKVSLRGWDTQRGGLIVRYGVPLSDVTISGGFEAILRQVTSSRDRSVDLFDTQAPGQGILDFDQTTLESNVFSIWDYGDFRFIFEDPFRNNEYRLYSPPADLLNQGTDAWATDYVIKATETFRETPEQYEYEAPGRQVEIPYLVSTFRGSDQRTDVYVHYGIPVQNYDPADELVDVTVNTGAFLINEDRNILVERRETLYGLRTAQISQFEDLSLWVDTKRMSAPTGKHTVSVEFETSGGGTVAVQRREVNVPEYRTGSFTLSDILLAYGVEETEDGKPLGKGDIVRTELSITPAPWSVFRVDQPIHLYFELYDLELSNGRAEYEVEASLRPKEKKGGLGGLLGLGGSKRGVSVRFEGTGIAPNDAQYLILDGSDLEPGLYHLELRVKDRHSGESEKREQDLLLEEPFLDTASEI